MYDRCKCVTTAQNISIKRNTLQLQNKDKYAARSSKHNESRKLISDLASYPCNLKYIDKTLKIMKQTNSANSDNKHIGTCLPPYNSHKPKVLVLSICLWSEQNQLVRSIFERKGRIFLKYELWLLVGQDYSV